MKSTVVNMGSSLTVVIAKLGQPKKESEYNGYKILWYDSLSPFKADIFYIKNDNLVLRSYPEGDDSTLSIYIDKFGIPERSIAYYSGEYLKNDSFETTLHTWPSRGIDVVSYGVGLESRVFLTRNYQPTSVDQYFSDLGQEFANNQVARQIVQQQTEVESLKLEKLEVAPTLTASQSSALFWKLGLGQTLVLWVLTGIVVLLALSGVVFFIFKKVRKNRQTSVQSLPISLPPVSQPPLV